MALRALIAPVFIGQDGPVLLAQAYGGVFDGTTAVVHEGHPLVITAETPLLATDGPIHLPPVATSPRPRLVTDFVAKFRALTGNMAAITVVWLDQGLA